jgi:hypothetical protein
MSSCKLKKLIGKIKKSISTQRPNPQKNSNSLLSQALNIPVDMPLESNDILLVSYPKSGNTWVRNIILHIMYPCQNIQDLKSINNFVPDLSKNSGLIALRKGEYSTLKKPRVFKTHSSYPFRPNQSANCRVIYIVRHPFDVVRSYYHYTKRYNSSNYSLKDAINKVIFRGNQWGTWQDNVLTWMTRKDEGEFLVIRYEDLLTDTVDNILKLANFLGIALDADQAITVRDRCSLKSMAKLENGRANNKDFKFVREEGSRRELENDLTPAMKSVILDQCSYAMKLFDYK